MLQPDIECRKLEADKAQKTLDSHAIVVEKSTVVPYSEHNLRRAVVEWMIYTNQVRYRPSLTRYILTRLKPLSATEHSSFINMIQLAARGPKEGVVIPSAKATRVEILDLFYQFMMRLRKVFEVRLTV
jgi:hypothetical protein